jgi:hypothetical protein
MNDLMKEFIINNSLEPDQKWAELKAHFLPILPEIKEVLEKLYKQSISYWNIPLKLLVSLYRNNIYYLQDLEYFAKLFELELHQVLAINLYYELNASCTTVCTRIDNNNVMFRTMDWPMDFLKKITYKAKYHSNTSPTLKHNWTVVSWFGCVGLFTACNDKYAIAINYRREAHSGNFITCVYRTITLNWPSSYMLRDIFEKDLSAHDAYKLLKTTKLIAPVYFTFLPTIGTPRIIQRSIESYTVLKPTFDCLCQTNMDSKSTDSLNILYSKERKEYVKKHVKLNYDSVQEIFDAINKFPVINEETLYISVMYPKLSKIDVKLVI